MKLVTKLTVAATLATFMFAGVNLTWGNTFSNNGTDDLTAANSFGVWLDVNDSMSFGWEGAGVKVGFDGPAGMQMRLGFNPNADAATGTSVGMSRAWWTSTGDGWGTDLSTALDWTMTGDNAGSFALTMNLGFGF
jgi:hypothetical protein